MRKSDDRESNEPRRSLHEEGSKKEAANLKPLIRQDLETLQPGFSWVRFLRKQHPGWDLASVEDVPWTVMAKPLPEARVALLTTAGVYLDGQKPFTTGPGVVPDSLRQQKFRGRGDNTFREIPRRAPLSDLRIMHPYYDHSDADEDINCVFPVDRLAELESENFIGEVSPVHYAMMGYIPDPHLLEEPQKGIIEGLKRHQVDAVLVTSGDPISHQTSTLLQRAIEKAGIATVSATVCRDITERLRAPRAVAIRFPLGHVFGNTFDDTMQYRIVKAALQTLETLKIPGTISDLPYEWVEVEEEG